MLIPLWLPWTVVVLLVVAAVFRPPVVGDGEVALRTREAALLRAWVSVVVVTVVAAVLTWDRVQVSEDELYEATQDAAALSDGGSRFSAQQIEVLLGDRLGRGVSLESIRQSDEEDEDQITRYSVQVRSGAGEAYDGAQACLEAYQGDTWYTSVDQGACEEQ